jgi:hypothetical protein
MVYTVVVKQPYLGVHVKRSVGCMMAKSERDDDERRLTPELEKHGVAFVFEPSEPGTCKIFILPLLSIGLQ